MLCTIGFVLIWAGLYALIGGIALKIAYRLFFREHSMAYTEAFKHMFIAGLFAFGTNFMVALAGVEDEVVLVLLPVIVNFVVVTIVLLQWEGLTLGQALGVGAITSGVFFLILLGIQVALAEALQGAGEAAGSGPPSAP